MGVATTSTEKARVNCTRTNSDKIGGYEYMLICGNSRPVALKMRGRFTWETDEHSKLSNSKGQTKRAGSSVK